MKSLDCHEVLSIPVHSKYLIIASFLASYNPLQFDAQCFSKTSGGVRLKMRGGRKKTSAKTKQLLLGPKMFTIDRMLAIFYNIIDDSVGCGVDIYLQV
jgi:origin recognition complex subunit 5